MGKASYYGWIMCVTIVPCETPQYHVSMATRRNRKTPRSIVGPAPGTPASISADHPQVQAVDVITPEDRRALMVRKLSAPGERRMQLAAELQELDRIVRPLVVQAVAADVPYRRIAELTGVSRATVARWVRGSGPEAFLGQ